MSVLFLDIDGVLNDHKFNDDAESCTIKKSCVTHFNRILLEVRPAIVLSSAWRYMIAGGAIGLNGFCYMLRTHGVHKIINQHLISITPSDEDVPGRGQQILAWCNRNRHIDISKIAILDDAPDKMCFHPLEHLVVKTDGNVGLTKSIANTVIKLLK